MVVLRNVPWPFGEPIAKQTRPEYKQGQDPQAGFMTLSWVNAFTSLTNQNNSTPVKAAAVSLTDQNASIAAVAISPDGRAAGLYRIGTSLRISTPDSFGSSLEIDFDWTYRGAAVAWHGIPWSGNDPSKESSEFRLIRMDALSTLRYATVWSMTSGDGLYDFDITVEQIPT